MDYIIIVAGGKGVRMSVEIPKQFINVDGKPILMHTIERFMEYDEHLNIILVLPKDQQEYWNDLCVEHRFNVRHTIVDGGNTRFESSKNGLSAIPDDTNGVVGIHDGVRPFVSIDTIKHCYDTAHTTQAVIPVLPVTDTLRYIGDNGVNKNVFRNDYCIVQTPQVFEIKRLKEAYNQPYKNSFTDDASVIESIGISVSMVEGNRENIKITTPFDLKVAEILVNK